MTFTRIRPRRDTAAIWASVNPVLALAEMGLETDTRKVKYGDGSTAWNSLPYASQPLNDPATERARLGLGTLALQDASAVNLTLPTYADDAAAGAAGLVTGDLYKTSDGAGGFYVKVKA